MGQNWWAFEGLTPLNPNFFVPIPFKIFELPTALFNRGCCTVMIEESKFQTFNFKWCNNLFVKTAAVSPEVLVFKVVVVDIFVICPKFTCVEKTVVWTIRFKGQWQQKSIQRGTGRQELNLPGLRGLPSKLNSFGPFVTVLVHLFTAYGQFCYFS